MHSLLQRLPLAALGGSAALLLAGCGMPTTLPGQGSAAKGPVAAASNASTAAPAPILASPATPTPGATTGAASHPAPVGSLGGIQVPSPSNGFQPPAPGLPGSGFVPPPAPAASGRKTAISVQLSAGVALAQTLPDGTGMLFSVDYRFAQRSNDQSLRYFWVILPGRGEPIVKEVRLEQSGTLQHIERGMRPEVGPFECRLDAQHPADSQRAKITGTVPMKQPG